MKKRKRKKVSKRGIRLANLFVPENKRNADGCGCNRTTEASFV